MHVNLDRWMFLYVNYDYYHIVNIFQRLLILTDETRTFIGIIVTRETRDDRQSEL